VAATTTETTCLFCSLCCPAGVAVDEYGLTAPEYPGHTPAAHHGLCYRGHFIAELANHPGRLTDGIARDGSAMHAVRPAEALRRAAELLHGIRNELAVVVDGNLPCEELAAAVRCARDGLGIGRATIFIPPADEAMLRGLAASQAPRLGEAAVAECDVLLAVGDPFATHPLIASPALDAIGKARGHQLINVDSLRGRTSRFAADFCLVRPGGDAAALAGILNALGSFADLSLAKAAEMAGVAPGALERIAAALGKAQKLGVLLSLPEGRCAAASAVAALAAKIALVRGGGICPLLTYGNAVGARRVAAALGATPLAQLLAEIKAGAVKKLIVLGTDLAAALPVSELASVEFVLAASAMPSATTARARAVVPMALWFEMGGTVVDGAGQRRSAGRIASPASGALTPSQVLAALGAEKGTFSFSASLTQDELDALLGAEAPAADVLSAPVAWGAPTAEGRLVLVSRSDGIGFADGSMSAQLTWPAMMEPRPVLRLNPRDAQALGGDAATVRSNGVAIALAIAASGDVPPGVAALSPRFGEARALFPWTAGGAGPALVTVEKCGGND